jgi:hypothetical protein
MFRHFLPRCSVCFAKLFSGEVYGVDAFEVEIEVNASSGNPVIVVMEWE